MSEKNQTHKPQQSILEEIKYFFGHIFDLKEGLDRWGTVDSIRKNIALKGQNVWLLISALFVASIGLDTASVAVIIGAMLISPLMSPILGIGLGIGINDRRMVLRSLFSFSVAVLISLIVSSLYFYLTPLGEPTNEILSRTRPQILDVFVAFFGGIAGIVASSRKDKMNAIPGVAIATALLPPLCVTGFGIANFNWQIAMGSFYLFFLNSVFVALATYLIIRLLRFPYKEFIDDAAKIKSNILLAAFVIGVSIPAILMLSNVIGEINEKNKIEAFITEKVNTETHQVMKYLVGKNDSIQELKLYMVGQFLDSLEVRKIHKDLEKTGLDMKLTITQFEKEPEDFGKLSEEIKLSVLQSVETNKQLQEETESRIQLLTAERDSLARDSVRFATLKEDVFALVPEAEEIKLAKMEETINDSTFKNIYLLYVDWQKEMSKARKADLTQRIDDYFEQKMKVDSLEVLPMP